MEGTEVAKRPIWVPSLGIFKDTWWYGNCTSWRVHETHSACEQDCKLTAWILCLHTYMWMCDRYEGSVVRMEVRHRHPLYLSAYQHPVWLEDKEVCLYVVEGQEEVFRVIFILSRQGVQLLTQYRMLSLMNKIMVGWRGQTWEMRVFRPACLYFDAVCEDMPTSVYLFNKFS